MTLVDPYGTSFNGCYVSLSVVSDVIVALRSLSTTDEFLISLGLLHIANIGKTSCADKVADFIAQFIKKNNLASKIQPGIERVQACTR